MSESNQRSTGDFILDRYAPNLSGEEREAASENLHRLARFLIRVHERLGHAKSDPVIRVKSEAAVEWKSLPTNV